jgi:chemotaxis protein MotB
MTRAQTNITEERGTVKNSSKASLAAAALSTTLLGGCVVWKSDYDALKAQNDQLQQQVQAQQAQIAASQQHVSRLQGAIAYTVNSDLLFAPGSWQMKPGAERLISQYASRLAPTQQNKLLISGYTDNTPIGPGLKAQGVTSNEELSQKRADAVMQYLISQGVNPQLVEAKGLGDSNPVAPNSTAAGRAQNRRVVLSIAQG